MKSSPLAEWRDDTSDDVCPIMPTQHSIGNSPTYYPQGRIDSLNIHLFTHDASARFRGTLASQLMIPDHDVRVPYSSILLSPTYGSSASGVLTTCTRPSINTAEYAGRKLTIVIQGQRWVLVEGCGGVMIAREVHGINRNEVCVSIYLQCVGESYDAPICRIYSP